MDETFPTTRAKVAPAPSEDHDAPEAERAEASVPEPLYPLDGGPGASTDLQQDPVLGTMVDVTSLLILSATAAAPKTVRDLAVELNLPIASLYRRVRALQSAGVLGAHKRKDRLTGKETMVYEGLVSGLKIRFGSPEPVVELAFRQDERDS